MAGWWLALFLTFSSSLCQKPIFPDLPSPRLVIVGPTGAGKSSLANALLGCDPRAPSGECMFMVCPDMDSCTKETTYGTGRWLGTDQNFTVVDTPGFEDSDSEGEELIEEMMGVLANQVDHADTMLLLFNGKETRFTDGLQAMLKKMTLLFSQDWWNFVVIGVSFWPYDQDSINDRQTECDEYPEYCRDEAWFIRNINDQMHDKLGVDRNFTFVFTDSWSQTGSHRDDPVEQEHWLEETGKLWEITTSRDESFDFMTIDDILEENARQRAEIKWLNDIISSNISDIMARLDVNSGNIEELDTKIVNVSDNLGAVSGRVALNEGDIDNLEIKVEEEIGRVEDEMSNNIEELDTKIVNVSDNLGAVSGRVALNEGDIDNLEIKVAEEIGRLEVEMSNAILDIMAKLNVNSGNIEQLDTTILHVSDNLGVVSGRVTLNEGDIDNLEMKVEEEIGHLEDEVGRVEDEMSTLNLAPVGTVTAWLGGITLHIPSGWQKCDGSSILEGPMKGQPTPDLNGEQLFLRGGSAQQANSRAVQDDLIKSHSHSLNDPGHEHTDSGHDHEDAGHYHSYSDTYNIGEDGDDAPDRWMGSDQTATKIAQSELGRAQITRGYAQLSTETSQITMGGVTGATAGSETRPRNMAVEWIIKVI